MTRGRKTGGRVAGTPNKVTAAVRAIASQYSAEAVSVLVELMRHSDDDRTRLVAAKELLDRAHGRPHQSTAETPPGGGAIIVQWQSAEDLLLDTTVETTAP